MMETPLAGRIKRSLASFAVDHAFIANNLAIGPTPDMRSRIRLAFSTEPGVTVGLFQEILAMIICDFCKSKEEVKAIVVKYHVMITAGGDTEISTPIAARELCVECRNKLVSR